MLAGLLLLVPAWATFLILSALFNTLDELLASLLGEAMRSQVPGLGLLVLMSLVLFVGIIVTHVVGQHVIADLERWVERIPVVRSIYLTLKGMTDLLQFRSRFGRSTVVAFPFPRNGLWALGFVMGGAPAPLQILPIGRMLMIFVPTAIHPFTGYLAFVPEDQVRPLQLSPEDAMKMEFSAGLYRPKPGWLNAPEG
jgi:uncharacterized membrane protein